MHETNAGMALHKPQEFYEIRIAGILDPLWHDWLDGLKVSYDDAESPDAQTIVSGLFTDQAALHGLLMHLRDSNLRLIAVNLQTTYGGNS